MKWANTSIIVSNGQLQTVVIVLVNELETKMQGKVESVESTEIETTNSLVRKMKQTSETTVTINMSQMERITIEIFKYLHEEDKVIVLNEKDYTLTICGKDIINIENEFSPMIVLTGGGITYIVVAKKYWFW